MFIRISWLIHFQIFTLRNLTYLDLKMFYSPGDEMEGSYSEYVKMMTATMS